MDINLLEYNIKDYISKLPEFQVRDFAYRMSKAGDCPRLMDYQIQRGDVKPDPSQALRMYFGTHIHSMWREIFEKLFPNDFNNAEQEITYVDGDLTITGHPDGQINSLDCVYELKSVSDNSFNMVVNNAQPMPMHYEQANMYAYVLKRSQILFHYFNKNNSESYFCVVPASIDVAKNTIDKFKQRQVNEVSKTIADRPYTDPTASPCWFCKYNLECYSTYKAEVTAMTVAQLDDHVDAGILRHTNMAWTMRTKRLESEKAEDNAKAAIADALIKRGIKAANINAYSIEIKLGSKNNPITSIKEIKK